MFEGASIKAHISVTILFEILPSNPSLMKWLFLLSGLLLVPALRMLVWGIRNKKRNEIVIGAIMLVISISCLAYYFVAE